MLYLKASEDNSSNYRKFLTAEIRSSSTQYLSFLHKTWLVKQISLASKYKNTKCITMLRNKAKQKITPYQH
jgi:hypothetical protein